MHKRIAFCLFVSIGVTAYAQTINVRGTVSNSAGKPIPNATVRLAGQNLNATTGSSGAYSITKTGIVEFPAVAPQPAKVAVYNGVLALSLPASYPVAVEIFDVKGNLLIKEFKQDVLAGVYRLNIAQNIRATNLLVVRATIGNLTVSFHYMPLCSGKLSANPSGGCADPVSARLTKVAAAVVDTLKASAAGYLAKALPISSYDSTVNITLDSAGGAVPSAGCGKTRTLQNGTITITFSGAQRKYILRAPDSYDNNTPYRLVLAYAWSGGTASAVAGTNYFTFATQDSKNTIFAAPDAAGGSGNWSKTDVTFTDSILTQLENNLCIDKSRVFATGFSMGGAMCIALACTRADVFRAVAFFSGADLTGSCPATLTKPIAYYASQASQDANGMSRTDPMTGEMKQAQFAAINGCTPEPASTNFPAAGQPHTCTIYKGCSAGHPTQYCIFDGGHGWEPVDPGQTTSWDAPAAWKFITQF